MTFPSDAWSTIPMADVLVSRAELYAHGDCGGDCDGPDPQPLGIGMLDVLLVNGQAVTIAALAAPPEMGGNYSMDSTNPTPRHGVVTRVEPPPLGLSRTPGHVYSFNTGTQVFSPLPSVTTVIGVLDKSGPLVGWAKREVSNAALRNLDVLSKMVVTAGPESAARWLATIPGYQRDTAADIGTRVHRLVEQLARGAEPEVTAEEAPFVDAYRRFLAAYRPRFVAVEEMVASLRHGYGGTLDAIAVIGGQTWLLDVKTGSGLYPETALQLAAYASAEFIGRPGIPRRFRLPRVSRCGVVHVRPEGARLVEYRVDRTTFSAFLEARRLFAWQQGPGKSVIGDPVSATEGSAAA